jgi:membrane protein YdbS with pleckstrin-like domain
VFGAALPDLGFYWIAVAVIFLAALLVLLVNILLRDEEQGPIGFARELVASPARVVRENLGEDEKVILWSRPAIAAFLVKESRLTVQTLVVMVIWFFAIAARGFVSTTAIIAFLIFDGHVLYLAYKRLEDLYTLYVFTNQRVMRLSGIFNRDQASIDWLRVVDFAWKQPFLGRLFGYATLRVDSASEKASLAELRDIPGRFKVNKIIVEELAKHTVE